MSNAKTKLGSLVVRAVIIGQVCALGTGAFAESWKDETVLISQQGKQTVVLPLEGDETLFENADPQLAVEWGLAHARTAVVLAGKYVVSDSIDIPRDDVTLIIAPGRDEQAGRALPSGSTCGRQPYWRTQQTFAGGSRRR